jgi:hypothetical protein
MFVRLTTNLSVLNAPTPEGWRESNAMEGMEYLPGIRDRILAKGSIALTRRLCTIVESVCLRRL